MKLKLTLLLAAASFIFPHCKKSDEDSRILFTAEQLAGLWRTRTQTNLDGSNPQNVGKGATIFGMYDESVVMHIDKTFSPARFTVTDDVEVDQNEEGTFEYSFSDKKLVMHGFLRLEFKIEKYDGYEMWLNNGQVIYKLFKQ